MNYLGHLFFSDNDFELAIANLFGDSVKGTHFDQYPPKVITGIVLHREIDHFMDTHPSVKKILPVLRPDLPKVASIAIDLFFDHLLAKHWNQFHPLPLDEFLKLFYQQINNNTFPYPDQFLDYLQKMIQFNWISYYPTLDGLDKMCHGVSHKLSFNNQLINGLQVFKNNEKGIEQAFIEYMTDANEHFSHYFSGKMS